MTNKIICPECGATLEHTRGYLPTHSKGIQRGVLVTGSEICDASNRKVITECKTIAYSNDCSTCGLEAEVKLTEDYPGAFGNQPREPWLTINCIGCSHDHDGYYCAHPACRVEVEERSSVFFRVSDTVNTYLPVFEPPSDRAKPGQRSRFRDFNTEPEASSFIETIETLPEYQTGRYSIDVMLPGWYAVRDGSNQCSGAALDFKRQAIGDTAHQPQFQPAREVPVLLYDNSFVIRET